MLYSPRARRPEQDEAGGAFSLMRHLRALLLLGVLAILVAGCGGGGGGSGLNDDDIAVVGSIHIKRSQYDDLLQRAKLGLKQQNRPFPKAGSQDYAALKNRAVALLVQAAEIETRAKEQFGIEITRKQVEARLKQIKAQYFQGSEKRYQQQLKKQGLTDEQIRADVKLQLIREEVFKKLTDGMKVGSDEVHEYYLQHSQSYAQPQSREVRHILVKSKPLADKIYAQLKGGASFAALAKKYSQDPGSKGTGGKLTVSRGQTVPQFDATAFSLKTKELSKPVKTQYGWHIIQALGKVRPPTATPEKQVRASIEQQLLQTKKNQANDDWVKETQEKLDGRVKYAVGFKPPPTQSATTG